MANNNNQPPSSSQDEFFPQSFFCPLTLQVMKDPVVDGEGNSYEREAIESWLSKNSTSPVTRNPLTLANLIPNRSLKEAIEERHREISSGVAQKIQKMEAKPEQQQKAEAPANIKKEAFSGISVAAVANKLSYSENDSNTVMVTVNPPLGERVTPIDICCVVDVSGSMGTEAVMQNASGAKEGHGLSLLDVVKHAVKTIIHILQPCDRLSLVSYSSKAARVFTAVEMNDAGKKRAERDLEKLEPDGQTNLWDGLFTGLEVLRESHKKGRLSSVLLLTDGQPNVIPPRGHLPMLQKYKDEHPNMSCSINTFGFGYNLDSALLKDLALEGDGVYAFIPDSGFVGTVFVNAVSTLLSTVAHHATVSLEPLLPGSSLIEGSVLGGYPCQYTSWGAVVTLASLQFEQPKSIVFQLQLPKGAAQDKPCLRATLKFETQEGARECSAEGITVDGSSLEVEVQRTRLVAVDRIRESMKVLGSSGLKSAQKVIKDGIALIKESPASKDKRIQGLLQDLEGQVLEAYSRDDYYNKWGVHYLPSLINAHLFQICNNFKDPGVQFYGGKLFQAARDRADDIFVKLPPPKPSYNPSATPVTNMSYYYNASSGCFHGDSIVLMANQSKKKVKDVVKGDLLMTPSGKPAAVQCVIKHSCPKGQMDLVAVPSSQNSRESVLLTPYHPVRVAGTWHFPCDLAPVKTHPCAEVFNFVLADEHVMLVNGVECVTLGHSFTEPVVAHDYFGSQRVVEDLKKFSTWESGLIHVQTSSFRRDPTTNLVYAISEN